MTLPLPTIASAILCTGGFSFTKTLTKLEKMIVDPLCTTGLLASVIGSDPMLAARVLSRANAATHFNQEPISQLTPAVARLGLGLVQGMLRDTVPIQPDHRRAMAAFWSHANATALMNRTLRTFCRSEFKELYDDDTIHLVGLLHGLGDIVCYARFTESYENACNLVADKGINWRQAMQASLGLHTGGLGMLLGNNWQLPEHVNACIRFHAAPHKAKSDQELVYVTHIAHCLVAACGFTTPGRDYIEEINPVALDELGLRITDLEAAIRLFFDDMDEMEVYEGVLTT